MQNGAYKFVHIEQNNVIEYRDYECENVTYTGHRDESYRFTILEVKETTTKIHTVTIQSKYYLRNRVKKLKSEKSINERIHSNKP